MKPSDITAKEGLFPTITFIIVACVLTLGDFAKLGNLKNGNKNPARPSWFLFPRRHKGCDIDTISEAD